MSLLRSYLSFFTKPTLAESKLKPVIYWTLFSLTGLIISNHGIPSIILTLKIASLMISISAFVYLLNDAMDSDMDKLNPVKSGRPIPAGIITKYQALQLCLIVGVIGISIAFTMNIFVLILSLIYIILGSLYSVPPFNLKKKLLMKETTTILAFFLAAGIGALASGPIKPSIFYVSAYFAILIITLYPTWIDALDMEEDKKYGVRNIASILDQKRRLELSTLGLIVMMITAPLSYNFFGFNVLFPIMICGGCFLFLRFIFPLILDVENIEQKQILKGSKIMLIFVFVFLFAFIFGSLQIL